MDQKNKNYPKFITGQVLTSDGLNKSFDYVEEQTRLTRVNFIGSGIVRGLELAAVSNKSYVTIKKGVAISPQGEYLQLLADTKYTAVCDSKKSEYEYLLFKTIEDAQKYGGTRAHNMPDLSSFVIGLVADLSEVVLMQCGNMSCDLKVAQSEFEIRPVLIKKSHLKVRYSEVKPIDGFVRLSEVSGFDRMINLKVFNSFCMSTFTENRDKVVKVLDDIYAAMGGTQITKSGTNISCWRNVFASEAEYMSEMTGLFKANNRVRRLGVNKKGRSESMIPVYYFHFLEDLALAANEFIEYYNEFVTKHPILPNNIVADAKYVVLGQYPIDKQDSYRYRWEPVDCKEFNADCVLLQRYFKRIVLMIQAFRGWEYKLDSEEVKFVWQRSTDVLGKRPLSYYYDYDCGILKYWDPRNLSGKRQVTDYWSEDQWSESTPDAILDGDVMTVQAYYRYSVKELRDCLDDYIDRNSLDIKVKFVELKKKRLEKQYVDILKKYLCTEAGIKAINNVANGKTREGNPIPSYYSEKAVNTGQKFRVVMSYLQIADSKSVVDTLGKAGAISRRYAKILYDNFKNLSILDIRPFLAAFLGGNYTPSNIEDEKTFAFCEFTSIGALTYNPDIYRARTMRGCKRNSTLVIFHFNQTALFDACIEE